MVKITIPSYSDFIDLVAAKQLLIQFEETSNHYFLYAPEAHTFIWSCTIEKSSNDATNFETNHKSNANKPLELKDSEGKIFVRAESRQTDKTTYFTCIGDNTGIGDGKVIEWDFSNSNDDVESPPSGYKQKKIVFKFSDPIQLKDGSVYWLNAIKGSYLDVYIYHPTYEQYIQHYVIGHRMLGDCSVGDELNTEAASEEIPAGLEFHLFVTVPDTTGYTNFHGHVSVEANRETTV